MTEWFTLTELCRTSHRIFDNTPTASVVEHLLRLRAELLNPLRAEFGPIWVNSGYRSPDVNASVGGHPDSAHLYGCAADIVAIAQGVRVVHMMEWLAQSGLPFDQAIEEHSSQSEWLHIAIVKPDRPVPRRQLLLRPFGGGFEPWSPPIDTT